MAETFTAWDEPLECMPAGTPVHLIAMVPDAPRAARPRIIRRGDVSSAPSLDRSNPVSAPTTCETIHRSPKLASMFSESRSPERANPCLTCVMTSACDRLHNRTPVR